MPHPRLFLLRSFLFLAVVSANAAWLFSQTIDPKLYVTIQKGTLPIIISAPHGGNDVITGVPARTGVGVSDFVTVRDSNTEELAYVLANSIKQRFGKSPYVVVCKADRLYVDVNRSAANAYEHPDAGLVYDYYHQMLKTYTRAVANQFHGGLVVDLHGQGVSSSTVYRGTRNGATCRFLRNRHGEPAHNGPNSLFGLLSAAGWTVNPNPLTGAEDSSFNGGYIVGTYGSQTSGVVDAIQLEFGGNYRSTTAARAQTSATLTNALATYARLYLRVRVPN